MDRLLTARAVAELLGVRPATVYTWVSNKCIPYQKVGGALRFNPKSIAKWLAAQAWPPPVGDEEEGHGDD